MKRERSAEWRMPTISAAQTSGLRRLSAFGADARRFGRARLPALRCGTRQGERIRHWLSCRKQFTVKVGTVFEDSHVPMNLWLQAMYLLCSSKKGHLQQPTSRTLGVTLKTAWFMSHRIREAMRVVGVTPMGGAGEIVEADETFIGRIQGEKKRRSGWGHKNAVLTLVQRGGGARSFHIDNTSVAQVHNIVRDNVARDRRVDDR